MLSDLDSLLDEADRALSDHGAFDGKHECTDEKDEEEEFDALEHFSRILNKIPLPPRTALPKITSQEDKAEMFRRRALELDIVRRQSAAKARPRILDGVALIFVNTCPPQTDGMSTHEQFNSDILQLEKTLPNLGFAFVDTKHNFTREQVLFG